MIATGILFAIAAMLFWGIADFVLMMAIRKTSSFKAFFWNQTIATVIFLLAIPFILPLAPMSPWILLLLVANGFLAAASFFVFCKALDAGPLSLVSPVSASFGVLTLLLGIIFLHEVPTLLQLAGIVIAIIGLILASFKLQELLKVKLHLASDGLKYAFLAMIAWAVFYILLDPLIASIGWLQTIVFLSVFAFIFILLYAFWKKEQVSVPLSDIPILAGAGVLGVLAYSFYGIGVTTEITSIVAPVTSLYPMVTVLLAWIFLKEKIEWNQAIGIALIIIGLVVLAL
ncbi:MAG: DMT family transporter [Candidatus Micrarchaeota archaeon]